MIIRLKHAPRQHLDPEPEPVHQQSVIHQRCADELRGACLRAGAAEGLLVTTGEFSHTARRLAGQERSGVAPVRLVDGEELLDLLMAHRLGVRERLAFPGTRRLEVDEPFFDCLGDGGEIAIPAGLPSRRENRSNISRPRFRAWRVTVRLVGPRPGCWEGGTDARGTAKGGR